MKLDIKLSYLGRQYPLKLEYVRTNDYNPSFTFRKGSVILQMPLSALPHHHLFVEAIKDLYLQRESGAIRERVLRVGHWFDTYLSKSNVSITELESGWTSHNHEGTLYLDWRLLMFNEDQIDVAIALEVLRLKREFSDHITRDNIWELVQTRFSSLYREIIVLEVFRQMLDAWEGIKAWPEKAADMIKAKLIKYRPKEMELYVLRNEEQGYVRIHDEQVSYVDEGYKGSIFTDIEEAKNVANQLTQTEVIDVIKMNLFVGEILYRNKEQKEATG